MSNDTWKQGAQDANQGKGPANTNGMSHQQANTYNASYAQNQGKK